MATTKKNHKEIVLKEIVKFMFSSDRVSSKILE